MSEKYIYDLKLTKIEDKIINGKIETIFYNGEGQIIG